SVYVSKLNFVPNANEDTKFFQLPLSGLRIALARSVTVNNLEINNCSEQAISVDTCLNVAINNIRVTAKGYSDISNYGCYFNSSRDCAIENSFFKTYNRGIDANCSYNIKIANNLLYNSSIGPHSGDSIFIA